MNASSVQSASSYGYGQLQRQQALRAAEQLETKAQALAAQATSARAAADDAVRHADDLEIQAGTARSSADGALQATAAATGFVKAGEAIGTQAERIAKSIQSENGTSTLYNQSGQSASASSYTPGSLLNLTS